MKNLLKSKYIPVLVLALGGAGCALRWLLYTTAADEKNLIPLGHPLEIALWLAAAAALVLAVLGAGKRDDPVQHAVPASVAAAGSLAAAIGIGATVLLNGPVSAGILGLVWKILGLASFGALAVAAKSQWEGKQPFFLLYAAVCVFFAVHMVSCYRTWSSNPQLQDYVFTLFSCIGLMLTAYQHGACAADCGSRRILFLAGLAAVFSCFVCLSGTENSLLYLTGGIWALTNLTLSAPAEECDHGTA